MVSAPPIKQKYDQPRFHLFEHEVKAMVTAARKKKVQQFRQRNLNRDATLIWMMFIHGLRSIEAVNLRWSQIDFKQGLLIVNRAKGGIDSTHPLRGDEMRGLRKIGRDYEQYPYVFQSERGTQLSTRTIRKLVADLGVDAALSLKVNPHMLRHSCGFYLAEKGEDTRAIQLYLGHKKIENTEIYTALSSKRFDNFFSDY